MTAPETFTADDRIDCGKLPLRVLRDILYECGDVSDLAHASVGRLNRITCEIRLDRIRVRDPEAWEMACNIARHHSRSAVVLGPVRP